MESVLTSIKKMLGIQSDFIQFDVDIIIHINSALMTLNQLGVGPDKAASISSDIDTWNSILGDISDLEAVKTYVYLKVKMIFDPPSSSFVLEAMKRQAEELEWRLQVQSEYKKTL